MDIVTLIKDIGIPAGLLILVFWKIVMPITDSHIAFINSIKISIEALTKSQGSLIETVNTISKTIDSLEDKLETQKCKVNNG